LARCYRTFTALAAASIEELAATNEIGPVIAESVFQFLANEENQHTIARLRDAGVSMEESTATDSGTASPQVLADKVFVLTGTLPHLTRQEAQALITAAGGRVTSSVTRKTDYVVAGTDPGSKYAQAQRLEIPILDEDDFYQLLGAESRPLPTEER
jgi:DNA ligase (NAD+)